MKSVKIKNILLLCWPFVASGLMLTVIQPSISFSALAWVALVPFILVCSPAAKSKSLALIAYLVSLCYWLGNLYWIYPVTLPGWLAFCFYTALLWPILAFALQYCRKKKIPLFIAVPVLFVGAERLQGLFLGGFFWRFLAHSQYQNITLIQIADIFGAAGVSFLIAMVNGLIAELIIAAGGKNLFKISNLLKTALVCGAVVAAVIYGRWRINQSDKFIEAGPLVAAVQSNVPQSVKESGQADSVIFDGLLRDSYASAKAGAELIVWPETMAQAILDTGVWPFLVSSETEKNFDNALREHSKNTAYVLVGAPGGQIRRRKDDLSIYLARYNSAFLYKPNGEQAKEKYNKIHLVPFGEVVPFKKSAPWLHKLLMKFTPYDYDYTLDYGSEYTVFEMADGKKIADSNSVERTGKEKLNAIRYTLNAKRYKFSVMICYEGTVPAIARRFAVDKQGRKRLDWLVNISNDGWFVRFRNGKVFPSTELAQHAAIYAFRAVENRLAVVRSVNTGISCLVDTLGRIRNGFLAGTLPRQAMKRTGCAGWFVDRVPIDKRTTFFSRNGQWLDFCCALGLCLFIMAAGVRWKMKNSRSKK